MAWEREILPNRQQVIQTQNAQAMIAAQAKIAAIAELLNAKVMYDAAVLRRMSGPGIISQHTEEAKKKQAEHLMQMEGAKEHLTLNDCKEHLRVLMMQKNSPKVIASHAFKLVPTASDAQKDYVMQKLGTNNDNKETAEVTQSLEVKLKDHLANNRYPNAASLLSNTNLPTYKHPFDNCTVEIIYDNKLQTYPTPLELFIKANDYTAINTLLDKFDSGKTVMTSIHQKNLLTCLDAISKNSPNPLTLEAATTFKKIVDIVIKQQDLHINSKGKYPSSERILNNQAVKVIEKIKPILSENNIKVENFEAPIRAHDYRDEITKIDKKITEINRTGSKNTEKTAALEKVSNAMKEGKPIEEVIKAIDEAKTVRSIKSSDILRRPTKTYGLLEEVKVKVENMNKNDSKEAKSAQPLNGRTNTHTQQRQNHR